MSRRIAHNGRPRDRTRLRRCSAMNERLPGGTRRASPAAVSNPALRHHRPRHRGDDTYPDDHARPARTEQAARGAAGLAPQATDVPSRPSRPRTRNRPARPAPSETRCRATTKPAVSGTRLDPRLTAPSDDEYEQRPARDAGGAIAALTSGRLHWGRAQARSGRVPGVSLTRSPVRRFTRSESDPRAVPESPIPGASEPRETAAAPPASMHLLPQPRSRLRPAAARTRPGCCRPGP